MTRRYASDKGETTLQRAICDALERMPVIVLRLHSGRTKVARGWMHHNRKGTPDLCVLLRGQRCVFLETKTPEGEVTEEQDEQHARLRVLGHVVVIPTSVQAAVDAVARAMGEG